MALDLNTICVIEGVIVVGTFLILRRFSAATVFSLVLAIAFALGGFGYTVFGIGPNTEVIHEGTPGLEGRTTMRAVVFDSFSKDGVVVRDDIPIPSFGENMMLIKVAAGGLNPSNYKILFDKMPLVRHLKKKWVVGYDVAGTVVAKGSWCDSVQEGDRVWGITIGSMAEYAVLVCHDLVGYAKVPQKLSLTQAAVLPVAGLTSLLAYERTNLGSKDSVLVIGASGGCGTFGVSLATHGFKAKNVVGLTSTKNVDLVKNLGAHQVVDYKSEADMKKLKNGGYGKFDVVYDTVTSEAPQDPDYEPDLRPLLNKNGRYIVIGPCKSKFDSVRGIIDLISYLASGLKFKIGAQRSGFDWFFLIPTKGLVERFSDYFDRGVLSPDSIIVDSTFQVSNTADMVKAMNRIKSRRTVGKIAVVIESPAAESPKKAENVCQTEGGCKAEGPYADEL